MKVEWKSCFRVALSAFLLYLAIHYWHVAAKLLGGFMKASSPLILGSVIAYLVNILMSRYEGILFPRPKRKRWAALRRPIALVMSYLTLFAVIILIINLIAPQLISCVQLLLKEVPEAMKELFAWAKQKNLITEEMLETVNDINWAEKIKAVPQALINGLGSVTGAVMNMLTSVFSGLVTVLLALIFSVYLLLGKERLLKQFKKIMQRYISPKWYARLMYALNTANDCFKSYTIGQCVEALILGFLCTVGMLIMGMPYALMSGALIAFTALVPIAGAYIGGGICAFMIFTVSPIKALIFIIFLIILQEFEGNIIYPRVVGSSIGLPGIWVLAAVTVGGGIMGISGMLLGVPLAATGYKILNDDLDKKQPKKKAE